ncbi:MAG TPA: hypothetical protein VGK93_01685 [Candidatus Eisenbacteria bacterium]|jgi:hypothetical protein
MLTPVDPAAGAFRELERRLTRRRWAQLDIRVRLELAGLAVLSGGFLFWQARVQLDGLKHQHGSAAVLWAIAAIWVALAGLGAALAGARHARRLRSGSAGPEWLSFPVPVDRLARHLAWDSRPLAFTALFPAASVLAAAIHLVPAGWLVLAGAGFVGLVHQAGRLGTALGERLVLRGADRRGGAPPLMCALAAGSRRTRRVGLSAARWDRPWPWLALWRKDLAVTRRVPGVARTGLTALALWALSLLAWSLPGEPSLRHYAAFLLTLLGAAVLAEWLVALSGLDPFGVLRGLPVGIGTVWAARFVWALIGAALVLGGHAMAGRELSGQALRVFLAWSGGALLGIAALGVNYGVTLFPRADVAQRLLVLSLGLAVAASIMIPLSGWVVLLCAVAHSARRLPRWPRLEEV